jgi:hypothetical protein
MAAGSGEQFIFCIIKIRTLTEFFGLLLASAVFLLIPPPFALLLLAYQVIACEVERFRCLLLRSLSAALVVEPESGKELGGKTQQNERAGGRERGKEGGREGWRERERRDKYR